MNLLHDIREPSRLLLTWQPGEAEPHARTRRIVGEIVAEGDELVLRYLHGTPDYVAAEACGFQGYPAFRPSAREHRQGVHEAFSRRLPPRKREDFGDFLAKHRLPNPFPYSDLALLGYTGAALPSDGFALVPDFSGTTEAFEFIMELAGVRHVHGLNMSGIRNGDEINFAIDRENPVDRDAVFALHRGKPLGYVNRALRASLSKWAAKGSLSAKVDRLNGTTDRPRVFVRLSFHPWK
ncbi:hypothetical protein [Paraburkholderia lycopersici]|uniref:hypothetical protein n=1 Tax=Paraburkholderia lycopersici TaxID=416944 RepID=UPI001160FDFB|nr:hypothetical protein [Paraburkholderia lycopersici]